MKPTVYLETTIISYLTSRPSRDIVVAGHQETTREWWARRQGFEVRISTLVVDECSRGDSGAAEARRQFLDGLVVLQVNTDVQALTKLILKSDVLPPKAAIDAAHLAVCAVHDVDFLMTWNCRHIANGQVIAKVRSLFAEQGYECPIVCTPDSLLTKP